MTKYTKPYLSISKQLDLLKNRGLIITDEARAQEYLARIGYYRLSGYWHVFRRTSGGRDTQIIHDDFIPDVTFANVVDLYIFDKRLRMLLLDAIERIEVTLRVDVALRMGRYDREAHLNPVLINPRNLEITKERPEATYNGWLKEFRKVEARSRETFLKAFKEKYTESELPIWMAVELWDFGLLSKYIAMLRGQDTNAIAGKYGMQDAWHFASTTRSIALVRNICAHHGRLWNKILADQPRYPKHNALPLMNPILGHREAMQRLFGTICIVQCYIRVICPQSGWGEALDKASSGFSCCAAYYHFNDGNCSRLGALGTMDMKDQVLSPIHADEAREYLIRYLAAHPPARDHPTASNSRPYGSDIWICYIAEGYYSDTHRVNIRDRGNAAEPLYLPFYDAAWELSRMGVLRPAQVAPAGMAMGGAFHGDGYSLTEYGISWITTASEKPHVPTDPSRFVEVLKPFAGLYGKGFMQRATEAVRSYRTNNYLACCVMAGGAVESLLLATAIQKAGDEGKILSDYRAAHGRKKIIDRLTGSIAKGTSEQFQIMCGILSFWRDEAGHGQHTTISEVEAFTALAQLLRLAQFTKDNWDILTAKG